VKEPTNGLVLHARAFEPPSGIGDEAQLAGKSMKAMHIHSVLGSSRRCSLLEHQTTSRESRHRSILAPDPQQSARFEPGRYSPDDWISSEWFKRWEELAYTPRSDEK
jgi:hypothetical protein